MKCNSQKKAPQTTIEKNPFARASKIFSENVECFQMACEIYKQILDRNPFSSNEYCEMVYMVEIKNDGSGWGATPKFFYDKEEAKKEAETLRTKYPFISDCRVVTRRMAKKSIRT